ncbi:MAG: hypothetical protein L0221_02370 [Chloroflexi bacterium]|nr:hypothetical protein [Chloroflexota bacterium]
MLREVEIVTGPARGWIDLLGYRSEDAAMLVVEVKRALDDVGRLERTLSWYERGARVVARERGWTVSRPATLVTVGRSPHLDALLRREPRALALAFPAAPLSFARWISDPAAPLPGGRSLALVDPQIRRGRWLLPTRPR